MKRTLSLDIYKYSFVILIVIAFQHVISSEQSVLGIPNKNASAPTNPNAGNASSSSIQNVTMFANNTNNTSGVGTKNNVTTSAGNQGNIYRGGTVSGSGGE